jgi:DNA polymerase/3'-5' exonuclease PolX
MTTAQTPTWPLAAAERIAWSLIERLKPVCEQVMLCGSIRRRRPAVHDIDIVCQPRLAAVAGLFGGSPTDTQCLAHVLVRRLAETGEVELLADGPRMMRLEVPAPAPSIRHPASSIQHPAAGIGVDIYLADAERFPMTAFLRTGSESHNRTLAIVAQERGMKLSVSGGRLIYACRDEALARDVELTLGPGRAAQGDYEHAVYGALGLAPLPPEARDPGLGNWVRTFD